MVSAADVTTNGRFFAAADERIDTLRGELLGADRWLPEPPSVAMGAVDGDLRDAVEEVRAHVDACGAAKVFVDRSVGNVELLAFGRSFGRPLPETASSVQEYVEEGVVLNLVAEHDPGTSVDLQPFSQAPITLHTEGSGRPVRDQPQYLVFACLVPPEVDRGGQTVLVPMDAVDARLGHDDRSLLDHTRYARGVGVPTIRRHDNDRLVFAFRDFLDDPLEWVHSAPAQRPADETLVDGAIGALLRAMYSAVPFGIRWEAGAVVVLDNRRFFHGRTASPIATRRHLKRLRLLPER